MKKTCIFIALFLSAELSLAGNKTVLSCGRSLSIEKIPSRAVSNDINLTEMMFALELQDRMAGYTGISGWQKLTPEFKNAAGSLPQLSEKTPTMETLLAVNTDLFFAGWNYGMRAGGPLTPHTLRPFNIAVYELTESCIHIMKKNPSSFDDVYQDILNLGILFNAETRAKKLVDQFRADVKNIKSKTSNIQQPVKVFLYDSGKNAPFTAGQYAIPNAMIEAAGGINILNDLKSSWTRTSWETIVKRSPDVIIIVNYGKTTAEQKIAFLKAHPALSNINAIRNHRFVTLKYSEATPGVRNVEATLRLAKAFYPKIFSTTSLQIESQK